MDVQRRHFEAALVKLSDAAINVGCKMLLRRARQCEMRRRIELCSVNGECSSSVFCHGHRGSLGNGCWQNVTVIIIGVLA